jgi:hypothetical protein
MWKLAATLPLVLIVLEYRSLAVVANGQAQAAVVT